MAIVPADGRLSYGRTEYVTGRGQVLTHIHDESACAGESCVIHNPSDHPMRAFPTYWRTDRRIMERTCPHGVGHPDPDDVAYWCRRATAALLDGDRDHEAEGNEMAVHGCDGCCHG